MRNLSDRWVYGISLLGILLGFHWSYGLAVIDPTNIQWLMEVYHDWGQHYLGWAYFRDAPWQFPLGTIEDINYPAGTNVGYMDSIPLLALFFKVFSGLLPGTFQYLGAYILTSHLLTGAFTIRLLKHYRVAGPLLILAAIFVGLNPLLFYRGIHPATTAHWLLLASLYYYLRPVAKASVMQCNWKQIGLVVIAALINPYLFLFVVGFNLILPLRHAFIDRLLPWWKAGGFVIISMGSVVLSWMVLGMLSFNNEVSMEVANSYGLYSTNLNAFINSAGYSFLFEHLPYHSPLQYEGYAYLGLGGMLLLLVGCSYWSFRWILKKQGLPKPLWLLLPLVGGYAVFAITHQLTWGDRLLVEVPIPEALQKLGSIFRASGRFIWLLYYVLLLGALIGLSRWKLPTVAKLITLGVICSVQFYDTQLFFSKDLGYGAYSPAPLNDEAWAELVAPFDRVITYPPHKNDLLYPSDYQDLCFLMLQQEKPIAMGYVARETTGINRQYLDTLQMRLGKEVLDSNELFITTQEHLLPFEPLLFNRKLILGYLDGYYYLYDSRNQEVSYTTADSNAHQVDSVYHALARHGNWAPATLPASDSASFRYNLESFGYTNRVMQLRGWAFANGTSNNQGDTTFAVLSNHTGNYLAAVRSTERKDVTGFFEAENLDQAGFDSYVYTHHLPAGVYALGMAIRKATGDTIFYQFPDMEELTVVPEFRPRKLEQLPPAGDGRLRANLETVTDLNDRIKISGWAMFMDRDATEREVQVVWSSDQGHLVTETISMLRQDVTAYFNTGFNYDTSGFLLEIKKRFLPPGSYTLGVIVQPPGESAVHQMSTQSIEIR